MENMIIISKPAFDAAAVKRLLYGVDTRNGGVAGETSYVCAHVSKMPQYYYVQALQADAEGRETEFSEVCGINDEDAAAVFHMAANLGPMTVEDTDSFMPPAWDGHQMPADCVVSGLLREALIACITFATPEMSCG